MIIHIRPKAKPRKGNQWYRDNSIRETFPLCGAEPTGYDLNRINKNDKEWLRSTGREICPICEKIYRDTNN